MADILEMIKPTFEAINRAAASSYVEGYRAAQRDLRLAVSGNLKKVPEHGEAFQILEKNVNALLAAIEIFLDRNP